MATERAPGELLDVRGAAVLLGRTELAIRKDIERKRIPHRRAGARVFLRRSELLAWLDALAGVSVAEAVARASEVTK